MATAPHQRTVPTASSVHCHPHPGDAWRPATETYEGGGVHSAGGLWLSELLDALRKDITVHVEAPGAAPFDLSAADKARAAALHTRRYASKWRQGVASAVC